MIIETKRVSDLNKAPYNPRAMGDREKGALKASIEMFGMVEPLVWNRRSGNLVGGHQRLERLEADGVEEVEVVVVDLGHEDEVALNITLNNPHIEGDWSDALEEVLTGVPGDLRKELNFDLLEAFAELEEPKPPRGGGEIDIDGLVPEHDQECPCCGFKWESDDKDYFEVTE